MIALFERGRVAVAKRLLRPLSVVVAGLALASCVAGVGGNPFGPRITQGRPVTVALLVPGESSEAGRETLAVNLENAARMAIGDLQGVEIDLRVYNTGGDAARAASQAARAASDGAVIILGPVFGDAASAAGQAVAGRGLNVLSFSNNAAIAGGNVFVLGPTFENTAARLLTYAASQNKGRVMIVAEQTPEGEVAANAIRTAAAQSTGIIAATETYEFSQQGVVNALPEIASTARASGVQSIFFTANTAGALPLLTQLLPENRVGPSEYQYIGLTRWDIPAATLQLSGVQDGWFALPDPALTQQFEARYNAEYGSNPHPIAALAYDGIAAIGALLRTGQSDALSRDALTQVSGFAGVNGVFRLRPDGTNERGLAVATIQNNEVVILDSAPRSFAGTGF
jgi:hypothetical protein